MNKWMSSADFINGILKEKVFMQLRPEGGAAYVTMTKTICVTQEDFKWMYKKVYD